MNQMALIAVLGALVIALPAFFFLGRRSGVTAGSNGAHSRLGPANSRAY